MEQHFHDGNCYEGRPVAPQISKWRVFDIVVCVAFGIFNFMYLLTDYVFTYFWLIGIGVVVFILCLTERFHRTDAPKPWIIVQTVLRCILCIGALIFTILPWTMNCNWKWYYPVQRAFYLQGRYDSVLNDYLPKKLPAQTDGYDVQFTPKALQGNPAINITYYTDSETIAEYKAFAESYGARYVSMEYVDVLLEAYSSGVSFEPSEEQTECLDWMIRLIQQWDTEPDADMEVYVFKQSNSICASYILNEKTGYFRIYY